MLPARVSTNSPAWPRKVICTCDGYRRRTAGRRRAPAGRWPTIDGPQHEEHRLAHVRRLRHRRRPCSRPSVARGQTFDGDLIVSMFTDDAEYHADLFAPPMVGHNAIRAYWLDGSITTGTSSSSPERHWVSGDTVLAAWHASYEEPATARACAWSAS